MRLHIALIIMYNVSLLWLQHSHITFQRIRMSRAADRCNVMDLNESVV